MNPVIQMTVAVALVVIAARMWPPLLYILSTIVGVLLIAKVTRRLWGWVRSERGASLISAVVPFLIYTATLLALAAIADHLMKMRISAVTMVMCFAGAYACLALLACLAGNFRRD